MSIFTMANTLIKSVFKKPATTLYPLSPKTDCELVRGHVAIDIDDCIFCGMCQRKCPTGAITVTRTEKEWAIMRSNCILCTNCVECCPKKCLRMGSALTPASTEMVLDAYRQAAADDGEAKNA